MDQNENQFSPSEELIQEYLKTYLDYESGEINHIQYDTCSYYVIITIRYEDYYTDEVQVSYIELLGFINKKLNNFMAGIK